MVNHFFILDTGKRKGKKWTGIKKNDRSIAKTQENNQRTEQQYTELKLINNKTNKTISGS